METDRYDPPTYVELSFSPSAELVSVVRRFIAGFFDVCLDDAVRSDLLAMSVHELLENASKYSTDGISNIRVDLQRVGAATQIGVSTWNRAEADDIAMLAELFERMHASPSPMDFYLKLMEQSTRSAKSQLGIGRVHAEAGMQMAFEADDGLVKIRAIATISNTSEPAKAGGSEG
jgi:hypothetical protein